MTGKLVNKIMKWNVITWKNRERKNHYFTTKEDTTAEEVAFAFSLKYCGSEGEILEILPLEHEEGLNEK